MHLDTERCLRAVRSRDSRFDGWFVTAVLTTKIYCRPGCPARTPKPENMRFYPSAAAAQDAGFRACKRCQPAAVPGSPQWNTRADLAARALRLIADGEVDRSGVPGLAARLGYSVRQVERHLLAEVGAGPLAVARLRRAQAARQLIETTDLPLTQVALAAGFASLRSFNDTIREIFGVAPGDLRPHRSPAARPEGTPAGIAVRLPYRAPLEASSVFGHLAATAVPGTEEWRDGAFRCTLRLPHGYAIATLTPPAAATASQADCHLTLADLRDLPTAVQRCRQLLDLDADPVAVAEHLRGDPVLAPLVDAAPGRRVPRSHDAAEMAVRAVLGQQVSTAAARTHAARLVQRYGEALPAPDGTLTHLFPSAETLAALDPAELTAGLAMPRSRQATLTALVRALADGSVVLGPEADWVTARAQLTALPGIGPWTAEIIAMRGLGDPDAFPASDLGVREAAARLGLPRSPAALAAYAERWRPWRAYAVQYLWATGSHPANRLPVAQAPTPASR